MVKVKNILVSKSNISNVQNILSMKVDKNDQINSIKSKLKTLFNNINQVVNKLSEDKFERIFF